MAVCHSNRTYIYGCVAGSIGRRVDCRDSTAVNNQMTFSHADCIAARIRRITQLHLTRTGCTLVFDNESSRRTIDGNHATRRT